MEQQLNLTPSARHEQKQDTRLLIAQTARKLFSHHGFSNVTIPDIAGHSGVSTGSIYNDYGNKWQLAEKVYQVSLDELGELLAHRLDDRPCTYDQLAGVAQVFFDLAQQDSGLLEFLFYCRHDMTRKMDNCAVIYITDHILRPIIERGVARHDLRPGNALAKAVAYFGVILINLEIFLRFRLMDLMDDKALKQITQRAWNAAYD